jgi:hypothetical protein
MVTVNKRMKQRRGTEAEGNTANPTLLDGEIGFATNTQNARLGDGATVFNSLGLDLVPEVATFPTGEAGARVFKTPDNIEFFYDGTRWLSSKLHQICFSHSIIGAGETTGNIQTYIPVPFQGIYSLWMENCEFTTFHTSNSASWTIELQSYTAANAISAAIASNTSTQNINLWVTNTDPINAVLSGTAVGLRTELIENSGSASFYSGTMLNYRLIGV